MADAPTAVLRKQHLIDPEICIRCNTCETMCPSGAISHDARNYVVDAEKCNWCNDCIAPCPTGSIDNYRRVPASLAYTLAEQLSWDALPAERSPAEWRAALGNAAAETTEGPTAPTAESRPTVADSGDGTAPVEGSLATESNLDVGAGGPQPRTDEATAPSRYSSRVPPWSAAHPYTQLYGPRAAQHSVTATVTGNVRVTAVGATDGVDYDTHHIVLDFGAMPFPVLEGQSIGVLPPGHDARGRPHHARQYSVASPRNGERPGYNNLSLTVKRVLQDHQGRPVRGIASNFLCDRAVGETVDVIGPFGTSFLMPNHPRSHVVMVCTGTGSAPMRAMTEWRRRLRQSGKFEGGRLLLFFGARSAQELPYFGPLQNLPKDFIDIHLAFSRSPGQPRQHVQDLMRERAAELGALLSDPDAHFYVCGVKAMEEGVWHALESAARIAGLDWPSTAATLHREGRLHFETY